MYLNSLHLQGFKSFATKTVLNFLPPTEKSRGITAIVGPNGSGKSNIVDALRWVMGEQSIKTLRGKKTEDVIFAGSNKKQRAGFAEVTLSLRNENSKQKTENRKIEDYTNLEDIEITRRVYRDGSSDYLLGKRKVRLYDIQLLLAKLGIGTKSYSIIGQGMIESILMMNDAEKKEFFDEATGIKQYQIKKNQAVLQLKNATSNMNQALIILQEIEPRMRYLKKQVRRLEEKEKIETELHSLQHIYYGSLYNSLNQRIKTEKDKISKNASELQTKEKEIKSLEKKLESITCLQPQSSVTNLQIEYQKLLEEKGKLKEKELELKNKVWRLSQGVQKSKTPSINIANLLSEIEELEKIEQELAVLFTNKNLDSENAAKKIEEILFKTRKIIRSLKTENRFPKASDEEKQLNNLKNQIENVERKVNEIKRQMEIAYKREEESKKNFINLQKELQAERNAMHLLENHLNNLKIELARLETRKETLEREMKEELEERIEKIQKNPIPHEENLDDIHQKIQKLKYRLTLAGGVDDGVVQEYNEINERYTFLKNQTDDLKKSITNLEKIISELDEIIEKQFNQSFNKINAAFGKYFKILFGGGEAIISKKTVVNNENEEQEQLVSSTDQKYSIEINAAPPGKKIKGIQMLSGGERALTAIALICGIIYCNPSPFIILDEVDAALDENNSLRFTNILKELSKQSQFIVITHNRTTMENASLLYGVTMTDDAASKILSINIDNIEKYTQINTNY